MRLLSAIVFIFWGVAAFAFTTQDEVNRCGSALQDRSLPVVLNAGGLCGDTVAGCITRMTTPKATVPDACLLIVLPLLEAEGLLPQTKDTITRWLDWHTGGEVGEYFDGAALQPATTYRPYVQTDDNWGAGFCRVSKWYTEGVTDTEPCTKVRRSCDTKGACIIDFVWPSGAKTVVESRSEQVAEAVRINGQNSGFTNRMGEGGDADCAYNFTSKKMFCFSKIAFAAPDFGGEEESDHVGLLESVQGRYRLSANGSCTNVGADGGAIAVDGAMLRMVETNCTLANGRIAGSSGGALFDATCSGEGTQWIQEVILRRETNGDLSVTRSSLTTRWQSCQ